MTVQRHLSTAFNIHCCGALLIGARSQAQGPRGKTSTTCKFNGRIESPRLFSRILEPGEIKEPLNNEDPKQFSWILGEWVFASNFETKAVKDSILHRLDGTCIQYSTRTLPLHFWDRETIDFRSNPSMYSSIEFHEDDNADCTCHASIEQGIPDDLDSGIYAIILRTKDTEDHILFFVDHKRGAPTANIFFLFRRSPIRPM